MSRLVASSSVCCCVGVDVGLLDGEPQRAGPHALGAHGQRGRHLPARADAAGGQHRHRGDGVDHLGPQHARADVAGVATALGALGDDDVDARVLVPLGLGRRSAQRRHQPPRFVDLVDDVRRRRAEGVGDQLHVLVLQRHLHLRRGGGRRPPEQLRERASPSGTSGHAVIGEDLRARSRGGPGGSWPAGRPRASPDRARPSPRTCRGSRCRRRTACRRRARRSSSSSISSCSGVKPTAPSTPRPPALLTAATTSRQWVKAKMGNSMPRRRAMSVCICGSFGERGGRAGPSGQRGQPFNVTGRALMPLMKSDRMRRGGPARPTCG